MSEDKPVFKVTDRRLFNPDGSPREGVERAPEPPPAIEPPPQPHVDRQAAATSATGAATSTAASPNEATRGSAASRNAAAPGAGVADANPGAATETDPLFLELMMFVAENAAAMLSGHPQFGGEVNLPYAKQFIDMLGALRDKTIGSLSTEEQTTLDTLLSQLRMQYVALTNPRPAGAAPTRGGGFTGGDITGAK